MDAGSLRTIIFLEARWARSFLTTTPTSVLGWSVRFVWRAGRSAASQVWRATRALFAIPSIDVPRRVDPQDPERVAEGPGRDQTWADLYVRSMLDTHTPWFVLVLHAVLAAIALLLAVLGLLAVAVIGWALPVLAVVVLTLLAAAARLPVLSRWAQPVVTALVTTVGDAAVWTTAPLRAAAMRDVVRGRVTEARCLADRVAVVAHSQGAAVSTMAVFEQPGATPVDLLVTVGGGNTLLREPAWVLGPRRDLAALDAWSARTDTRWVDIIATLDPVPAGPVGNDRSAVHRRWTEIAAGVETLASSHARRAAESVGRDPDAPPAGSGFLAGLFFLGPQPQSPIGQILERAEAGRTDRPDRAEPPAPPEAAPEASPVTPALLNEMLEASYRALGTGAGPVGPEEHVVDNRLSLLTDHVTYSQNIVQVIDPIARLVAGPDEFDALAASGDPDVGRHVHAVTALLLGRFVCAGLAVLATPALVRMISPLAWVDAALTRASSMEGAVRHLASFVLDRGLSALLLAAVVALIGFAAAYAPIRATWRWYETVIAWGTTRRVDALAPGAFFGTFGLAVAGLLVLAAWRVGVGWDTATVIGIVATTGATLLVPLFRVRFLVMPARRVSSTP